jgi:hypothetical protein
MLSAQQSAKHCHPAAERNKDPILQHLKLYIDPSKEGKLLEISSGSGQHVAHFSPNFPKIVFQPTEVEQSSIKSIEEYRAESQVGNILPPRPLDVRDPPTLWLNGTLEPESFDYMVNINLIHISEWTTTPGLFNGVKYYLKPGGKLFTYGPYAVNGVITPQSNIDFHTSLQARNPSWGLRDIVRDLVPLASKLGIHLKQQHDLPANNKFLVWEKEGGISN